MKINAIVTTVCIICLGTFSYAGGAQGKPVQGAKQKKAKSLKKIKGKAIRKHLLTIQPTEHHAASTSSGASANFKAINSSIHENLTPAPRLPTRKKGKIATTKEDTIYSVPLRKPIAKVVKISTIPKTPSGGVDVSKIKELVRIERARPAPAPATTTRDVRRGGSESIAIKKPASKVVIISSLPKTPKGGIDSSKIKELVRIERARLAPVPRDVRGGGQNQ